MNPEHRIREAETRLFARSGLQPEESFLDLGLAKVRLRVLSAGAAPPASTPERTPGHDATVSGRKSRLLSASRSSIWNSRRKPHPEFTRWIQPKACLLRVSRFQARLRPISAVK